MAAGGFRILVSLRFGGDHRHLAALVDRYQVAAAGGVLAEAAPERVAVAARDDDRVRVGVSFAFAEAMFEV